MEIRTYGGEERTLECERRLSGALCDGAFGRLIILPVPTSPDGEYIKGTSVLVTDVAELVEVDTAVVGYNIPPPIVSRAGQVGARLFDAAFDEDFLLENAELTARGAVGYILTSFKCDPSDMKIGIVGYGRIGKCLLRLLLFLKARVTLYTTRREVALSMCEVGVPACVIDENCDFSGLDILINTAPARQINPSRLDEKTKTIDLASGNVFDGAEGVVKLSSVPTKYYPITAGRVYAMAAERALSGGKV